MVGAWITTRAWLQRNLPGSNPDPASPRKQNMAMFLHHNSGDTRGFKAAIITCTRIANDYVPLVGILEMKLTARPLTKEPNESDIGKTTATPA